MVDRRILALLLVAGLVLLFAYPVVPLAVAEAEAPRVTVRLRPVITMRYADGTSEVIAPPENLWQTVSLAIVRAERAVSSVECELQAEFVGSWAGPLIREDVPGYLERIFLIAYMNGEPIEAETLPGHDGNRLDGWYYSNWRGTLLRFTIPLSELMREIEELGGAYGTYVLTLKSAVSWNDAGGRFRHDSYELRATIEYMAYVPPPPAPPPAPAPAPPPEEPRRVVDAGLRAAFPPAYPPLWVWLVAVPLIAIPAYLLGRGR